MMARRGSSDAPLWLLLLFLLFALGGVTAASSAYRGLRTIGWLGGVVAAWYTAYPGSTLPPQAVQQMKAIAAQIRAGAHAAADVALEQWLLAFDPLGLVRDAIDRGEIRELP